MKTIIAWAVAAAMGFAFGFYVMVTIIGAYS